MRKWFILFIISILPLAASAEAVKVGDLWYNLDESAMTAEVTSSGGDSYTGEIAIPSSFEYGGVTYTVTSIGRSAFSNTSITKVEFPSSLISIGESAFNECSGLTSLTIPSSLKTIDNNAFWGCWNLEKVIVPDLASWCSIAFGNYDSNPLYHANHLYSDETTEVINLVIPSGVTSIGKYAFLKCTELTSVLIPSSITSIGEEAFWECNNMEKVIVPDLNAWLSISFSTQSANPLYRAHHLYSDESTEIVNLVIPSGTTSINSYAFCGGSGFGSITIPNSVTIVGKYAFQSCYRASFESFPSALISIGESAFYNCNGIRKLSFSSDLVTIENGAFSYCYGLNEVEFPSTLSSIGNDAFRGSRIKKLVLPSSLTYIGDWAFAETNELSIVTSRIQEPFDISESVFCTSYSSSWSDAENKDVYTYGKSSATLYIPVGKTSAYQARTGWNMFADIVEGELKEATVDGLTYSYVEGKGVAAVIGQANDELSNITIPGSVPIDGTNYSVKSIAAGAFQNCTNIDTLVILSGVETIGKNAFQYCYNLKSVTFPEGVKTIGENAFRESGTWGDGLRKIELPSSLDSIGDYAFFYCRNLTSVVSKIQTPFSISENVFAPSWSTEENGVTTWPKSSANLYVPEGSKGKYEAIAGWNMFAGIYEGELLEKEVGDLKYAYLPSTLTATVISGNYSKLNKVTIPGTVEIDGASYQVKEIGSGAFRNCYNLDTVIINNGVEIISDYAFQWCTSADFGTLPSSLRTIGDRAFWNCNMFKNLEIPEGVQTLGSAAFGGCYNLQKVILPSTLTGFGERVFEGSDNLSSVVSHIREPFTISEKVFATNWSWDENNKEVYTPSAATLFVPEGTKAKYEAIPGWTMFAAIYEGELIEQKVGDLYYSYNTSSKFATVVRGDDYSKLTKVEVPSTVELEGITCRVKEIAPRAFSGTPIASLVIEEGLESIGTEAFANCQQLSTISLPSSLTTLGDATFRECNRLGSVVIPSGLTSLGYSVFAGCKNLNSLEVAEGNEKFESRGSNAVIETSSNTLVQGCNTTVIPTSVTAIGKEAFIYLDIKAITIPSSVKTIGENAFNSCHNLKEVVLPEGLETLGNTAFHSCSGLTMVELPNSLKSIGGWSFQNCLSLVNVVSNIENPKGFDNYVFGENNEIYSRATLWVPKGKINTYKALEGWNRFKLFDELLRDNLTKPTITYNGRYMTMTNDKEQKADIYYSVDGSEPTILYRDTIAMSNLGTILAISKRFGSYTVDTTRYEVTYVYDGVTARTASEGLLAKCFEWSGTDKVEMLDIDGTLNDDDFGTIRSLSKLATLNMAASKMTSGTIPSEAFANTKLQWYVSPYTMNGVGANIFKGCNQLSAITWNSSSVELPEDVVTDVANPNMLVYAKAQAMIPYSLKNVVVNGYANNIVLADSAGNNNFYCPEEFIARRISYTHNYQQPTLRGTTQGWETLALPFTVSKIIHETKGEITPSTVEGAERPFWLYELGDNGLTAATQIRANIPYLICMPNDDAYGDEYILGGRVTFSAQNVTITTSGGTTVSQGDRQFVPTYKAIAKADGVYALNIGEAYNGNPMGSVFVQNYREVRPFEAYSVHSGNKSRTILLSSLGGGDATGINDLMLKNGDDADGVVKVYSLSGALIKQGKREETLRSLPKGLYIIDGKKVIK